MGININVPNQINQNTPLRTVRSGATEEPDNNVKYVPQTLTEAQQAQARQNIGAISASEIPASAQANWNETDTESPAYIQNKPTIPAAQVQADWNQFDDTAVDYIKNKPTIPAAQVQSDWNQSDDTAVDYIKNKPNLDTKYFGDLMDMYNVINIFTTHNGKTAYPNNGNELGNVKDIIIGAQSLSGLTMYDSPRHTQGTWHGRTAIILDPQRMSYNGYWRFYPDSEFDDLWFYPGINDNSQKGQIDNPIQEIWCKDVNIVLRGTTGAYGNYKRINRIKQSLQLVTKFTVWNTTNTGWQGLWDGTGDVVLFDTEMEMFVDAVNAPNDLIGFKIYMPKSRYTEFVAAMTAAWGSTAVNDYILPKVEQYDFVYSEGFKYRMITLPTA